MPDQPYDLFGWGHNGLWYPGWTMFGVITRRDFGAVQWLPDQIDFTGCLDHQESLIKVGLLEARQ